VADNGSHAIRASCRHPNLPYHRHEKKEIGTTQGASARKTGGYSLFLFRKPMAYR